MVLTKIWAIKGCVLPLERKDPFSDSEIAISNAGIMRQNLEIRAGGSKGEGREDGKNLISS